jgi:hypothetical protein
MRTHGGSVPEVHRLWANLAVPELGESALACYRCGFSRGISALESEWLLELLAEGCAEGGDLVGAKKTDGNSWRHNGGIERRLETKRAYSEMYERVKE